MCHEERGSHHQPTGYGGSMFTKRELEIFERLLNKEIQEREHIGNVLGIMLLKNEKLETLREKVRKL